jgi:hypothetical protein
MNRLSEIYIYTKPDMSDCIRITDIVLIAMKLPHSERIPVSRLDEAAQCAREFGVMHFNTPNVGVNISI